jgi:hypothetical protein
MPFIQENSKTDRHDEVWLQILISKYGASG